jgi:hypothetical protein
VFVLVLVVLLEHLLQSEDEDENRGLHLRVGKFLHHRVQNRALRSSATRVDEIGDAQP